MKLALSCILTFFIYSININALQNLTLKDSSKIESKIMWSKVEKNVTIGSYFSFIDAVVSKYETMVSYTLSEHILVNSNPWIIDKLANTDYYRMIARDSFVYDQRKLIILKKNDSIKIPSHKTAEALNKALKSILIDVNIPEFKLRIYQDSILKYTFPIRVGQHVKKYLKLGDRITDLRTKTGNGTIIRHERNPAFYNPVTGNQFFVTKRDDLKVTVMPQIPWIETEINGIRNGQMIHPTTNPKTLGKAYSNGCIGTKEADAWIIYYKAPLGTKINIRYNLKVKSKKGDLLDLKDIYKN